jgi:hypothetical protein
MKTAISLTQIDLSNRHGRMVAATDEIVRNLKERFPEAQGFKYKIEERLAQWAWPRGTKLSEAELIHPLDPENRKRAFRRGIRVTQGLRWGLTMDIQSTDREMEGLQVKVLRESPLSVFLAMTGLIVGILATIAYGYQLDAYKDDYRNIVIAMFIGFAVGGVLAGLGWLLSRPLESLSAGQAQEIFDAAVERATRAIRGST